jgi:iron complex outermembrane receptor protein
MDFDARVTRGLKLSGGLTYLHSRFLSFPNAPFMIPVPLEQGGGNNQIPMDAKGNPLPYAPNFVGNVTAEYDIPIGKAGELQLAGNYNYNSGYFAGPDRILKQQPYEVTNLSLSWALPNGATRVGLWAKNLFQTEYYSFLLAGPNSGGFDEGVPAPPRTFGLSIRQEF